MQGSQLAQLVSSSGSQAGKSRLHLQATGNHRGLWAKTRDRETGKGPQCRGQDSGELGEMAAGGGGGQGAVVEKLRKGMAVCV